MQYTMGEHVQRVLWNREVYIYAKGHQIGLARI